MRRPHASLRVLAALVAAGAMSVTIVPAAAAPVTPARTAGSDAAALGDPDPDPPSLECLENTRVNGASVNRRSTFGAATVRYSWDITPGCAGMRFWVDGQQVDPKGSREVSVPTSRYLAVRAFYGSSTGLFGFVFVLAGRFVTYTPRTDGTLAARSVASSGITGFDAAARTIMDAVRAPYVARLEGNVVEIHLIPRVGCGQPVGCRYNVTDLPPFDYLDPQAETGNPADGGRTWGEVRGLAHPQVPVVAVGEGRSTRSVTHELAHAVLLHAAPHHRPEARAILARRIASGVTDFVGCDDRYARSTVDEYWAEGSTALVGGGAQCFQVGGPPGADEYEPQYLRQHDRPLECLLRRVYDLPEPASVPGRPPIVECELPSVLTD